MSASLHICSISGISLLKIKVRSNNFNIISYDIICICICLASMNSYIFLLDRNISVTENIIN